MIITSITSNLRDDPALAEGRQVVEVTFQDLDLDKRIQRVRLPRGGEVGLRLNPGHPILREGDVLHTDEDTIQVVRIAPTDVLVITPVDAHQMGFVAHTLGNRHLPAQFTAPGDLAEGATMIVQYDHTVVDFLRDHDIAHHRADLVPPVPFRHSGHTH